MIDCKATENYLTERKRMCISFEDCTECDFQCTYGCKRLEVERTDFEKAIEIVQKWSNEHPQRTLLSEFLEHYPKTELNGMGLPNIAPCELGLVELNSKCIENCVHQYCLGIPCKECWDTPINESEETK